MRKVNSNKFIKHSFISLLFGVSVGLNAEVSKNLGFNSEYYFRGVLQKESSAFGGLDYEQGRFSVGTWVADVGEGLEVDIYSAYGFEISEDLETYIGFTHYYYTGEFDDTYQEINLGFSYKNIDVDYSVGSWDGGDAANDDYDFLSITYSMSDFYGKYGVWGDEFDGDYFEFGWGADLNIFELGIALIISSDELSDQLDSAGNPTDSEALVLTITKTL